MIETIVFDFGKVVGYFDHRRATTLLAQHCDLSPDEILSAIVDGNLEDDYESGRLSSREFVRRVRKICGLRCSEDLIAAAFADIFWLNQDVCSLIPRLSAHYRLLLGSNTCELHAEHFKRQFADVLKYFDHLVLSFEIGVRKPKPGFFEHCRRRAGSEPSRCLFIDDLTANVEGARACGWHGIVYQGIDDLRTRLALLGIRTDEESAAKWNKLETSLMCETTRNKPARLHMQTMSREHTIALALTLCFCGISSGQTSYPMITHVTPVAVERGKTTEVLVEGQMNFERTYKALFEGSGITADVLSASAAPTATAGNRRSQALSSVKLTLTVAPEAVLGAREFRLASDLGISSIGQLLIVDAPVVMEKEANNSLAQAQAAKAPCVVVGQIAVEDMDFFKLHAEAGQTLSCEVFCARLQDKIHDLQKHADPMLTLFDADGRELAANDDFYFADPLLTYTVPKSGDYFLQIRDSKYDGDRRWVYAVRITTGPYVANVYPLAIHPGQNAEVEIIGAPNGKRTQVTLPRTAGVHAMQLEVNGSQTNPAAFYVTPLPLAAEKEPNDQPESATRVTVPCCINGRIGVRRDLDHFVLSATKGRAIRLEVHARRFGTVLQSSLDSVLDVLGPKGNVLANNDDAFGKDSSLVFTPPADGDYILRIRDLNSKGGDNFVYAIDAEWALPDFTLRCDPDKAMIGPGSSTAWYVHVTRQNGFAGPVKVEIKDLPKGVSASALTIPPEMTQGVVVLTAAADATREAALVQVIGSATVARDGKNETLTRLATPNQEIYLPGGGRGRFDVRLQAVAVTAPSDILKVDVKPETLTLKPGGEARLDVTIHRRADYNKDVTIDVLLSHLGGVHGNPLPPGVTVADDKSKTALRAGTNQGHIVLKAAPNAAPIDNVPICVLAHVSINFVVKVSYASPPILVSVKK